MALVALIGGVASACSSDRVMLSDGPFSNPFGGTTRTAAAPPEIQPAPQPTAVAAVPTAPVQSEELPPVQAAAPAPRAVASSAPVTSSSGGWSTTGGTRITVGANDSLTAISQRYGVPTNAILQANNLAAAGQVQPGREIVIPVYNASGQAVAAAPAPVRVAAPAPVPVRTAAAAPLPAKEKLVFVVGPKPAPQKTADKPDAEQKVAKTDKTRVRPGMVTAAKAAPAPAVETAAAKPAPAKPAPAPLVAQKAPEPAKPAPVVAQKAPEPAKPVVVAQKPAEPAKPAPQPEPVKVAKVEPQPAKAAPAPAVPQSANSYAPQPEAAKAPAKEVTETGGLPSGPVTDFRWPARGRVIAGFGANGGNEGINIALPEGTPVKATDDGTVTYVGGDVKAYGNLVLIKHDNGFVSAYAHNGEIAVKRGERVRRGQVVAKSGQSGNVTSPQLHFELRKGQAAVDPIPHLNGG